MTANLKALIVVLAFAALIFRLAKPLALKFGSESDFTRRRNTWLILTVAGFVIPNFWLFTLIAVPTLTFAGRKDTNPIAFYLLLLHVIPAVGIDIPAIGVNQLFELDIYRLLAFCVLIPTAWQVRRQRQAAATPSAFGVMDLALLAYGALTIALYVPPDLPNHVILSDSFTNVLRRAFLFLVDTYVLYFVVSRRCASRGDIVEALAAFCLSCALIAPLAVFETLKGWLLYTELTTRWTSGPLLGFYLLRAGSLRPQVSTGNPLALGYMLAIAFGFWLYLGERVGNARMRLAPLLVYGLGLLAAYARGPWIGAVSIYGAFVASRPRAWTGLFKALVLTTIILGAVLVSPLGDRITNILPFTRGSVDTGNVIYREHLAQRSLELIRQHPFFGDQLALQKMQNLRQGMGIIDLVNTYTTIAVLYGLVGLSLFMTFIIVALYRALSVVKRLQQPDPDFALLGTSLIACIVGTLVMIAGTSFIFAYEKMFYVLAGLAAAYIRLGETPPPQSTASPPTARLSALPSS